MSTNKIQKNARFEKEISQKITFIAKKNRRSFNAQMEFLAQECIEKYESENGVIEIKKEDSG